MSVMFRFRMFGESLACMVLAAVPLACTSLTERPGRTAESSLTVADLERDPAMAEMRLVQHADPTAALEAALARDDKRLLGIAGFAMHIPGPQRADELARTKYGVREINGGGDAGISDTRLKLIHGAAAYAGQYNTLLLRRLGELPDENTNTTAHDQK